MPRGPGGPSLRACRTDRKPEKLLPDDRGWGLAGAVQPPRTPSPFSRWPTPPRTSGPAPSLDHRRLRAVPAKVGSGRSARSHSSSSRTPHPYRVRRGVAELPGRDRPASPRVCGLSPSPHNKHLVVKLTLCLKRSLKAPSTSGWVQQFLRNFQRQLFGRRPKELLDGIRKYTCGRSFFSSARLPTTT